MTSTEPANLLQSKANLPAGHPRVAFGRVGVLIVNLGSPPATDTASVRRYLRQFLSDPRVIEIWRPLWLAILNIAVLTTRPKRSAHAYSLIWDKASNESPLIVITRSQAGKLGPRLAGDGVTVDWAMRYGAPSIAEKITVLRELGAARILVVPLYPQYSATTTASVEDAIKVALDALQWSPPLKTAAPFYADPAYVDALAAVARDRIASLGWAPERVILSFHGLPERLVRAGDPYERQCVETARLLRARLGWGAEYAPLAFQSRFGPEKWLGPAADQMIGRLAAEGVKRVAVMTPGFVADCLETLEEIAIAGRATFLAAGGESFAAVPCLNDAPATTALLQTIIARETAGWP